MVTYDPRAYWSKVSRDLHRRGSLVAGDENPFLRYKREKFLSKFLSSIDFRDRVVLELGQGPGGNLKYIAERAQAKKLLGADISETMRDLASHNLRAFGDLVELHRIDGRELPFGDRAVDLSYTVTVLHHVTEEAMFLSLVKELCRVTKHEIVIMEDIGSEERVGGQGSFVGRTIDTYRLAFGEHGFQLSDVQCLGTRVSRAYYMPMFRIYRRVVRRHHREGDDMGFLMKLAIGGPLQVTRRIDGFVNDNRDLAKMVFRPVESRSV
jgi:SAM-dependent methyltransferase